MSGPIPSLGKGGIRLSASPSNDDKFRFSKLFESQVTARPRTRGAIAGMVLLSLLFMTAAAFGQTEAPPSTITVSFQGSGSSVKQYVDPSGWWQRVTYTLEASFEVEGHDPVQSGDMVTYQLTRKVGTLRFQGTAEDHFEGATEANNFDRARSLNIELTAGTLTYNRTQCSGLIIEFPIPSSGGELPDSIYLQYSAELGIIRDTVNMPYPWNLGYIDNNYDVPGTADLDCCAISLTIDKAPLPPGETARVTATTSLIDPEKPLQWEIFFEAGKTAKAKLTPDGGLNQTATITDAEGEGYVMIQVTNPSFDGCIKKAELFIGCGCGVSQSGQFCVTRGREFFELSSIAAHFNLGRTKKGESAGDIFLKAETPSPANATPQILEVFEFGNDLEILTDQNGLRQVVAPDAFVDISVIDAYRYVLSFYRLEDKGNRVDGYYAVASGAAPTVAWTIENPDTSPTVYDRLRLTENKAGRTRVFEYAWNAAEGIWSLSKGNGLQVVTRKEETIASNRVVTETIQDASGSIASRTRTTYAAISYNGESSEEIIEIVEDPDNTALTTIQEWYQDPCPEGSCGQRKSQVNPDGSWVKYEYDASGRKVLEIRSWLDAPLGVSADEARAIYYDYAAQDSSDSQAGEDARLPRKITETILGNVVAVTYHVYIHAADGSRTEIVERAAAPGAAYGTPGNLRTVTEYYPHDSSSASSWKVKSVTFPDGRKDTYRYEYGTFTPNPDPNEVGNFVAGAGSDVRETIIHGTTSQPSGVAFKTTGERRITNSLGDLLLQETYVYNGSGGYLRIEGIVQTFDEFGHVLSVSRSDGTLSESTWDCCGKSSETDAQGISKIFSYDDLNRLVTETKLAANNLTTTFTYDGAGRRLTQTTSAEGLSRSSSSAYDGVGRPIQTTDPAGLVTTYAYSADGRVTAVTRPGGATEITERYPDGRVWSVTGSAVIPRTHTYGVNGDGTRWTRVDMGAPSSPIWEKTTVDMLGRTIRVEKPGFSGMEATEHFYNNLGQLVSTTTPGLAHTLYTYDEVGNQVQGGLDVDGNGVLNLGGLDRISETQRAYAKLGDDWWDETVNKVYARNNDSTATVVETSRNRLTGLGAGGLTAQTVAIDVHGNQTVTRTVIVRNAKTTTQIIDTPHSTINAVAVSTNGLLVSSTSKTGVTTTFIYDPLERQTGVTEPRTGATLTAYNGRGWVDYVQDPAGNRTTYGYDLATGRKTVETNALGKAIRFAYNDRGQITRTWGDSAYPVEYAYDVYGRMSEMHTWRVDVGWAGEAWPEGAGATADVTRWHYQESTGLLVGKEDNAGKMVTYTYEAGGRLASRTWARTVGGSAVVTRYSYDPATGELLGIDYSDATPDIAFTYDRLGRPLTVTDAVGIRSFAYNDGLQLEKEIIMGLTNKVMTRSYESSGVVGRAIGFNAGDNYSNSYGYDGVGRLNAVGWNVDGVVHTASYTYVPNSDLLRQMTTDDGLQTTYTYEPKRDLRTRIHNQFGTNVISQYDYQYDALGRRSSVVNSGQAFASVNQAFNLYGYNDRSELAESARYLGSDTSNTSSPVSSEYRAYTYDPIGNRIQHTEAAATSTYTTNGLNQYTQQVPPQGGTRSFTYDDDGDLTSVTDGSGTTQYQYNAENRLILVQPASPADGGKKLEFTYDYMGRRVRKTVQTWRTDHWEPTADTLFLYDGWNLISEWPAGGAPSDAKYYVWGLDLSQTLQGAGGVGGLIASFSTLPADFNKDGDVDGSDLVQLIKNPDLMGVGQFGSQFSEASQSSSTGSYSFYYFYDGNGNVGQLVNSLSEGVASHYAYDPYGKTILSTGLAAEVSPIRFSTKYSDSETKSYSYLFRYHSPELGRWLNRDPMEEEGGRHLYAFVLNNPLNGVDPFGTQIALPLPTPVTLVPLTLYCILYPNQCAAAAQNLGQIGKEILEIGIYTNILLYSNTLSLSNTLSKSGRDKTAQHRGRIQAQGNNMLIEKSEPWNQRHPLTLSEGRIFLGIVVGKLTASERYERESAIIAASEWMTRVASGNGIGPTSEHFYEIDHTIKKNMVTDCSARIDIEVISGIAFVLSNH